MSDEQDILLTLKFHNNRLKTNYHVPVRLASWRKYVCLVRQHSISEGPSAELTSVTVVELVVIPIGKILRICLLHTRPEI